MSTVFRDTQFGAIVRLVSGKRVFQYPDEVDSSLWEKSVQHDIHAAETKPEVNGNDATSDEENKSLGQSCGDSDLPVDAMNNHKIENGKDIFLIDWYGPDDPENPQNWSSSRKALITFEMCILNFAVYIASSIYTPGIESIMEEFGSSVTVATLGLSLFTIGYGMGPMLWSPMSEIPMLGRSPIYFWTLLFFVLLQLPTGFAVNMGMFLFFRWLTGFVGSPSLATGGATLSDIYPAAKVPYAICIWASFGVCGPVFGPLVGGFTAEAKGWRWTIWIFTWLCVLVLFLLFFCLPETSASNILYRRAQRLRVATGNDRLRSQSEIDAANQSWKDHARVLSRAAVLAFTEPIVFFTDLYTALLYGILFTWFESFPLVFGEIYGFSLGIQGLTFLGIFVGGVLTVPFFLLWVKLGIVPKITKPGFRPEMVLPPTFFGAIALPVSLFWYGWSARESLHWIMPIIGSSFFTVAVVTMFNAILNYLGVSYPHFAASIFAGNALFRASFGAIFPLFARQLFRALGEGGGNSLLGGIAICFIPIPIIFYKYGSRLRQMSRNAVHDKK